MKFVVLASTIGVAMAYPWDALVSKINSANTTWTAAVPSARFGEMEDVKTLCGTWMKGHANYKKVDLPKFEDIHGVRTRAIPASFDARTDFANCSATIGRVRDQSACGSCWAFGSTEAFEGASCVANGKNIEYSAMDTAGCCKGLACGFSQGCGGGQPSAALSWMVKQGVVTGGDYDGINQATGGCKPYEFAPCAHHVPPSAKYPACPSAEYSATCKTTCQASSGATYAADKVKAASAFDISSIEDMQTSIMTYGPLSVAFTVYEDFPTYKSGIYKHTTGQALGGHAVSMVGWGTEGGVDYWIIKNSWNEQWGDGGAFKIVRGTDECGIESEVSGIKFH